MKALILAAGYATRLYPLTKNFPKALLNVKGKPMIDYIVDEINTISFIDEILIVSNHKYAEHFQKWQASHKSPTKITVIDDGSTSENDRLGAIGDINFTIDYLKSVNNGTWADDLCVICGDNYFTFKLKDFADYFKRIDACCVVVKRIDDYEELKRFAVVEADENARITGFEEKPENPKSQIAAFGAYIYKRDAIPLVERYLKEGNKPDAPGYFIEWLYRHTDVYAYEVDGECIDIGTVQSYEEINK